uniref:Uncharacterized protein n=1 Tax=Glossina pallidipes TaxID=7398 RepID=A0A1A9Z9W7_GLOPL
MDLAGVKILYQNVAFSMSEEGGESALRVDVKPSLEDNFTWTEKRNHPHYKAAKKAIKHVFKVEPTSLADSQQSIESFGLRESLLENAQMERWDGICSEEYYDLVNKPIL